MARSIPLTGIVMWLLLWPALAIGVKPLSKRAKQLLEEVAADITKRGCGVKVEHKQSSIVISEEGLDIIPRLQLWDLDPKHQPPKVPRDHVAAVYWVDGHHVLDIYNGDEKQHVDLMDDGDGWYFAKSRNGIHVIKPSDPRWWSKPFLEKPQKLGRAWMGPRRVGSTAKTIVFREAPQERLTVKEEPQLKGENILVKLESFSGLSLGGYRGKVYTLISGSSVKNRSPFLGSHELIDRGTAFEGELKQTEEEEHAAGQSGLPSDTIVLRVLIDKKSPRTVSDWFHTLKSVDENWWLAIRPGRLFYISKSNIKETRPAEGEITKVPGG